MRELTEHTDPEIAMYTILDKAKKNGIYESIGNFVSSVIKLYMKRFGDKKYATSIPEKEFTEQIIDCVEHLSIHNEDGKKIFSVFTSEMEQTYICGMITGYMLSI